MVLTLKICRYDSFLQSFTVILRHAFNVLTLFFFFFYRENIQRLLKVRLRNFKCQHNDFNLIVFLISTVFGPKGIRNELTQVETGDVFW